MRKSLIFSPHPDDAEWAMGGTIALMIKHNWKVIVVDLTSGEPTPNGSTAIRKAEAKQASKILGIKHRYNLDLPNRYLEYTLDNRKRLAEVIRREQPDILVGPALPDQHPDHVEAAKLIQTARFEAKLHKTDLIGEPHWTPKLYHYYSNHRQDFPAPSFVVDISDVWKLKMEAVKAYRSQITSPSVTISPHTRLEAMSQFYGHSIGFKYGEPFYVEGSVAISNIDLLF